MSEVDLRALAEAGRSNIEAKSPTPMQELNLALKECGFGRLHILLLVSTFLAYVAGVLMTNTTSFLLPSAECDLKMNLVQKGLLNASPYIGTILSSIIAGFLTDTFGRKIFIQWGLLSSFVFCLISGSSQNFETLLASKFMEGLLFACYFTASITLTSEFCYDGIRDRVLILQSSYMSIAQFLSAVMAWGILPNDWNLSLFNGKFVLHTWHFYLYLMALWTIVSCLMYLAVPESPKYLLSRKRYDEARAVLIKVYKVNTGKPEDTYLYKDIWKDRKISTVSETDKKKETLAHQIVVSLHNCKSVFQGKQLIFILIICTSNLIVMAVYNTFRLWYPQVSTIVEYNEFVLPDGSTQDLCMMLDTYTSNLRVGANHMSNVTVACVTHKSGTETYINSIIVGCVSFLPHLVSGILVAKIGKKPIQIGTSLIAVAATLGLRFTNSDAAVVSLFSLAIAITQSAMTLNQVCTLEYLPTNVRSLGIALMMTMGRIGTLAGNILFPVMLDMGCSIPFYTMCGLNMCVVVMLIFLPTKKTT